MRKTRKLPDGSDFEVVRWKAVRKRALATYEHICALCGQQLDQSAKPYTPFAIEVDHIIPVSRNGQPYELDNLRLLCHKCNRRKSNRLDDEINRKPEEYGAPISNNW